MKKLTQRNGPGDHHHHHHPEGMGSGHIYKLQLAELREELNTESEEKERLRASWDFWLR